MSRLEKRACDFCGENTVDHRQYKGWIKPKEDYQPLILEISTGKGSHSDVDLGYKDFCSAKCFLKFLELKGIGDKEETTK